MAVADAGATGLKIYLEEAQAVPVVQSVLDRALSDGVRGGKGPIYFCLMGEGLPGEVELDLGDDFPVNPQIKGALRSLGGVIEVEDA